MKTWLKGATTSATVKSNPINGGSAPMSAVIGSLDLTLPAVDTATKPVPVMDAAAALATLHSTCQQSLRSGLRLTFCMPFESKSLDIELMDEHRNTGTHMQVSGITVQCLCPFAMHAEPRTRGEQSRL